MLFAEELLVQLTDPSSGGLYGGKEKAQIALAERAGRKTISDAEAAVLAAGVVVVAGSGSS